MKTKLTPFNNRVRNVHLTQEEIDSIRSIQEEFFQQFTQISRPIRQFADIFKDTALTRIAQQEAKWALTYRDILTGVIPDLSAILSLRNELRELTKPTLLTRAIAEQQTAQLEALKDSIISIPQQSLHQTIDQFTSIKADFHHLNNPLKNKDMAEVTASVSTATDVGLFSFETRDSLSVHVQRLENKFEELCNLIQGQPGPNVDTSNGIFVIKQIDHNKHTDTLTINETRIDLGRALNQSLLSRIILRNITSIRKIWPMDELLDHVFEIIHEPDTSETTRKDWTEILYQAARRLNIKVLKETNLSDFLITGKRYIKVNPKYLP